MPNISCPRCAGETASQSERCSNCGYHISPEELADIRYYNQLRVFGRVAFISLIGLAAIFLFMIYAPDPFEEQRSVSERALKERDLEEGKTDSPAVAGEAGSAAIAEDHYDRGMSLMGRRDYENAAGEFSRVLEIDGSHTGALFQRALARESMDDVEGAVRDLDRLTAVDPDHYEAYIERAFLLFILDEFERVLDDLSIAVTMNPGDQQAWYLMGRARTFLDDDEGAIRDYNRALDLDPEYHDALLYRGIGRFQLGDVKRACADWHRAMELGNELAKKVFDEICSE